MIVQVNDGHQLNISITISDDSPNGLPVSWLAFNSILGARRSIRLAFTLIDATIREDFIDLKGINFPATHSTSCMFGQNQFFALITNIADIVIRYGFMMAIGIAAVFLKMHILFFVCTFILWEGMMGWCVVHHMLGIDHHNSKKNKSCWI